MPDLNPVLDVALGLIFFFLLLSLFCTAANELVAYFLNWRAAHLEQNLKALFDDDNMLQMVRVFMVGQQPAAAPPATANLAPSPAGAPSPAARTSWLERLSGSRAPTYLSSKSVALAITAELGKNSSGVVATMDELEKAASALPASRLKTNLLALLQDSQHDYERFQTSVSQWFDGTMQHLSEVYRSRIQAISLLMGLIIAVSLNADAIHVAKLLWINPDLRSHIVRDARDMSGVDLSGLASGIATAGAPPAAASPNSDAAVVNTAAAMTPEAAAALAQIAQQALARIQAFPLGWSQKEVQFLWSSPVALAEKVLGLLLTTLAMTLGAPFWFDLLKSLVRGQMPTTPSRSTGTTTGTGTGTGSSVV